MVSSSLAQAKLVSSSFALQTLVFICKMNLKETQKNQLKPLCLLAGSFLDHVTILLWFFWLGKKSAKGKILDYVIFFVIFETLTVCSIVNDI